MSVKTVQDPITGNNIHLIEGVIEQIAFQEATNDRFGNTHRAGIKIGDTWVNSINLKTKEGFDPQIRINAGDRSNPNWVGIERGDKVRIVVDINEWKGKTYYNSGVSKINLIEKGDGGGQQQQTSSGGGGFKGKPKDNLGVVAGNARTAATNWVARFGQDVKMKESVEIFAALAHKWRNQYAKLDSNLSEFEVGVSVGQAVVAASQLASSEVMLDDIIEEYLHITIPHSLEVVKNLRDGGGEKVESKKVVKEEVSPDLSDMGDNLPF